MESQRESASRKFCATVGVVDECCKDSKQRSELSRPSLLDIGSICENRRGLIKPGGVAVFSIGRIFTSLPFTLNC